MSNHTIKVDAVFHSWLAGTVDGLPYAVKVCDEKSEYGIDGGKIIKLYLFNITGKREVATYERGWMKYPIHRYEDSMDALIAYCCDIPSADRQNYETDE